MGEEEAKRDRISELPEEIKGQIVSSLRMKDAVRTSALSSVWRYSWVSSLPFLDFGYHFYLKFTSFFDSLPATHPKKRHLYSVFRDDEEDHDSESTIDDTVDDSDSESDSYSDSDYDYDYDSDSEYNDWITKHACQFSSAGYLQMLDDLLQIYTKKIQSLRVLKKMCLYVPMQSCSKLRDYGAPIVSRCLSLAKHNVIELDYWFDNYREQYRPKDSYSALQNCLPILDSKTLTKLNLYGCCLTTEKKVEVLIDLPNLKHLCLTVFKLDENMLETLLSKCRALEKLELSSCKGFKVLRVPRVSKLKKLKVLDIVDLDKVEINAMEIQRLTLINLKTKQCKVKMASNACNNLVKLFVNGCGITDDFFNNVTEFPHLETLFLMDCPKLKHIKITGNSLRSIDITECPNLSEAEVDTPRLFISGYSFGTNIKRLFSKRGVPHTSSF